MKKMDNETLVNIIRAQEARSLGRDGTELTARRQRALDRYNGKKYGDEVEGDSQAVSKDMSETIDWIMPAIMNVLTRSGDIAEFIPIGEEDEELAEQEMDYTNHVIMVDNPGFLILHDAVKETLMLGTGYFKHWQSEDKQITYDEFTDLETLDLTQLLDELESEGYEVEITEQKVNDDGKLDVCMRLIKENHGVKIEAIPVEEVRVSERCKGSLQGSPFTQHRPVKTRSELIEMGMPKSFVNKLPRYSDSQTQQKTARDKNTRNDTDLNGLVEDPSMDEIEYLESYIMVDWDGDGIAELRKVIVAGNEIPPGKQWNEPIDSVAMTAMVAKRMPHRHDGESIYDELEDLTRIKTILTRQMLNNIYKTNNGEWLVNDKVNIPDFLESHHGGLKRVKGIDPVQGSAQLMEIPQVTGQLLQAMGYIDSVLDNRTGINKLTTAVDPDILKSSTKGAYLEGLNRASQKVEMIIRMLAETGVKELVLRVHDLLIKNPDKERIVKLRGEYVPINPSKWKSRMDLRIKVGLGTGTEEEKRERLMIMANLQEKLASVTTLVDEKHAHRLFSDILKTLGSENPDNYVYEPDSPEHKEYQQKKQQAAEAAKKAEQENNILAEAEKVKGQANAQIKQMELQFKQQLENLNAQTKTEMEVFKAKFAEESKEKDRELEKYKADIAAEIEGFKAGLSVDLGKPGVGNV